MSRRRPARRSGGGSGSTLVSAFVLSLMLLILLFTQRQIAGGVVDAFNAMTVVPGEGSADMAVDDEPEVPGPSDPRGVGIEFYEPRPLTVEVARTHVFVAAQQALNQAKSHGADDEVP